MNAVLTPTALSVDFDWLLDPLACQIYLNCTRNPLVANSRLGNVIAGFNDAG